MLIGEVAKRTELTKKALYYYEEQGLIHPEVQENGYRYFTEEDVFRIKKIITLRSIGVSIADIKLYFEDVTKERELLEHYATLLNEERDEIEEKIKMCEKLIENDLREYIELKKNTGSYREVKYPYDPCMNAFFQKTISNIIFILIFSICGGLLMKLVPELPNQVVYIFGGIIFVLLSFAVISEGKNYFTEEGIYWENSRKGQSAMGNFIQKIKHMWNKKNPGSNNLILYNEITHADIKWVKEQVVRRWSVPKVWIRIHTENNGVIAINPFALQPNNDPNRYLFEMLTILFEHNIPIYDKYRIIGALEQGEKLSEYIEYLSLDNGAQKIENELIKKG